MLRVLVFVALAVTTAAGEYVSPFSQEAFEVDYPFCVPENSIQSSMINVGTELTCTRGLEIDPSVVTLTPGPLPELQVHDLDPICGSDYGLLLGKDGDIACSVTNFRLIVDNLSDEYKKIRFTVMFLYDTSFTPVELEIPVYQIPATTLPSLEEWATNEKVELFTQLDAGKLEDILENTPTVFNFQWLNKLVSKYGIFVKGASLILRTFVTRPVVLPESVINKLIDTVIEVEIQNYIRSAEE